jgi:hypothetical protein
MMSKRLQNKLQLWQYFAAMNMIMGHISLTLRRTVDPD